MATRRLTVFAAILAIQAVSEQIIINEIVTESLFRFHLCWLILLMKSAHKFKRGEIVIVFLSPLPSINFERYQQKHQEYYNEHFASETP